MSKTELPSPSPANRRYRCAGGYIRLACDDEAQWRALCKCLGRPELSYAGSWEAARAARPRGRLGRLLERLFAADPVDVWLQRLASHGVPAEPVNG
ncbi:MAG TPA: CoA transferase [Dehalococcoidia bacterium]|nr:CoA transferase [Dehalococcoidia bacterium]